LITPVSQLQTQQLMTSLITSHINILYGLIVFLCSFCSRHWFKI